jgi:hypothetical protein
MSTTRRGFIGSATNAAALAVLPASFLEKLPEEAQPMPANVEWDVSWPERLKGKHRAVFDNTEIESGSGVWRAAFWQNQYIDVMKVAPADLAPVLILRHSAIILAMQQAFWDKYNIGELKKVTHPLTEEPTNRNPVLMDERDGLPAPLASMGLHKQLARGAVALACNLALQDCVGLIRRTERVSQEEAQKQAVAFMVPGVILQPSGVFAAVRAQQAGAVYVKAS